MDDVDLTTILCCIFTMFCGFYTRQFSATDRRQTITQGFSPNKNIIIIFLQSYNKQIKYFQCIDIQNKLTIKSLFEK